ncbi:hypothetical protein NI395_001124 [Salmonella enterica]|nr:hypothetical protein [Salmonella enterica]EJJ4187025.1 hypothetical protein [Salmonella enterica]EKS4518760.1 hypothetical protein [Salmonella enterica]
MEEFKGTPGPWVAVPNNYYIDIKPKGNNQCLASTQENEVLGIDRGKERANAYLIAAAPELLESLQDFMAESAGNAKSCGHDFECICRFDKARAAIAKALGK